MSDCPLEMKYLHVGMRVRVCDDASHEPPLPASVVQVDIHRRRFSLEWDHNQEVGWQSENELHLFKDA